jgi:chromosome segregation ATPase
MGVFSAGNIVAFILNVLICVFFYLLGNSKRLEKVKKYGEKLMGEMRELADNAKVPLENFKIDLEVETKASEQLLQRLKDVRMTIAGYDENIKRIEERFEQFNALLAELDRESIAVEENLLRIRDESVFADRVSRKIASARKRFDALERELGVLKESLLTSFEKTSAESLEKTTSVLFDATKATAASLQIEVEQNINALTRTMDTVKDDIAAHLDSIQKAKEEQRTAIETSTMEVNRLAEDAVKKAGERSGEYEVQLFRQLREEIDGKVNAVREKLETGWQDIQKASEANRAAISTIYEELESAKAGVRDTVIRAAAEEEALWHEKLGAIRRDFEAVARQTAETEDRAKALQAQNDGFIEKAEAAFNTMLENAGKAAAENAEKFSDEKFAAYRTALEEKLGTARIELDTFASHTADMEGRMKALQAQTGGSLEKAEAAFNTMLENAGKEAAKNAEKFSDEKFAAYRAAFEEKLGTARLELDTFASHTADMEGRMKALQAQTGGSLEKAEAAFNTMLESTEKRADEQLTAYRAAFEKELGAARLELDTFASHTADMEGRMKVLQAQTGSSIEKAEAAFNTMLENAGKNAAEHAGQFADEKFAVYRAAFEEKLGAARLELDAFASHTADMEGRMEALQTQADGSIKKAETAFNTMLESAGKNAAESAGQFADEKFAAYRAAFEEKLGAARLELDTFVSHTTDMEGRMKVLQTQADGSIEKAETAFNTMLENAGKNAAESAGQFADEKFTAYRAAFEEKLGAARLELDTFADHTAGIEDRIKALQIQTGGSLEKAETDIAEMLETAVKSAAENAGKMGDEKFAAYRAVLEEKMAAFENMLHTQVDAAGENLDTFQNNLEQDMKNLRNSTEAALESESGKLTADIEKRMESVRLSLDEMSAKSNELKLTADEKIGNVEQRIASLNGEIDRAKEKIAGISEQTKLLELADSLRVDLERKIETMKEDIERLVQEKSVLTGMEVQLDKIKRMEEEMNVKITRFQAEQKRIDIMESDFNRLVKISSDIEYKLRNISAENETLEQVQVKLRKLAETADASEEKYQRVEKRNNIIETTNAGISANFKKLEDAERRIEAYKTDITNIGKEISGVTEALAKIKFENSEALEISKALSSLDTSLSEIETRIDKMQTAREWLAGIETRMNDTYRKTMENMNRIDEMTKRNLNGGTHSKVDVLSPSIRDEVRRLKQEGWRVEAIARNLGISEGEVQLILEVSAQ